MLKEIYHLLLPSERRMGMRVIMAVFFSALLNFAGLAALIPVLLFLIEEKEEKGEALLFCLLAVGFILFKNYGSRSKKGEIPRFELSHNALNRKPQK